MASLIATIQEIENRNNDLDGVRRERIRAVEQITSRPLVVYATAFLNRGKVQASGGEVGIDGNDKLAFDEVISGLDRKPGLDVLIHSPGGEPEAAEAIVEMLRSEFPSLRFIVPDQAKSTATMMCCAADEILMDQRSELGPIDPQMLIARGDGQIVFAPAQAIIDQFDRAKESLAKNRECLPAWLPILQPLSPSLLTQCEDADRLSRSLVSSWL
jgi:ClpP class serine protease